MKFHTSLPFSTTEHTEAAFAGTESGWGKGTETPNQPLYYPTTCGRFEHFFDTPFPLALHLPYIASSKKFKATALVIEKRALWFPKEIPLPFTILKYPARAI